MTREQAEAAARAMILQALAAEVETPAFKDLSKHNDERLAAWAEHSISLYENAGISKLASVEGLKATLLRHTVGINFHTGTTLQETLELVKRAWAITERTHKA